MPVRKKRSSNAAALDMSVFGNPKTRTRAAVAQVPSKNPRAALQRVTSRASAVAGGKAARGSGRPPGADWYRVEDVRRAPVTDTLVRTPVTDRVIHEHRGAPVPSSALEMAKLGAAAGGGAVLAGKLVGTGLRIGKRVGKSLLKKVPGVGTLLTAASVGRTAYKIAKTARATGKLNKAQAVRALISSAL